jgi:hypothetical protein
LKKALSDIVIVSLKGWLRPCLFGCFLHISPT